MADDKDNNSVKPLELTAMEFAQEYSFRYLGVDVKTLSSQELQILLVKHTVAHLLSLGALPIVVDKFQDWFLICSSMNWHKLGRTEDLDTKELFYRPIAAFELSKYDTRSEFILQTFSKELFVIEDDRDIVLKGKTNKTLIKLVRQKAPYTNVVAFK